jgi:hypothetical protein
MQTALDALRSSTDLAQLDVMLDCLVLGIPREDDGRQSDSGSGQGEEGDEEVVHAKKVGLRRRSQRFGQRRRGRRPSCGRPGFTVDIEAEKLIKDVDHLFLADPTGASTTPGATIADTHLAKGMRPCRGRSAR